MFIFLEGIRILATLEIRIKIKAGRFRKRYLSCNRFARKYFGRVRCLEKLCSLFINMAFVTDVKLFWTLAYKSVIRKR